MFARLCLSFLDVDGEQSRDSQGHGLRADRSPHARARSEGLDFLRRKLRSALHFLLPVRRSAFCWRGGPFKQITVPGKLSFYVHANVASADVSCLLRYDCGRRCVLVERWTGRTISAERYL